MKNIDVHPNVGLLGRHIIRLFCTHICGKMRCNLHTTFFFNPILFPTLFIFQLKLCFNKSTLQRGVKAKRSWWLCFIISPPSEQQATKYVYTFEVSMSKKLRKRLLKMLSKRSSKILLKKKIKKDHQENIKNIVKKINQKIVK